MLYIVDNAILYFFCRNESGINGDAGAGCGL